MCGAPPACAARPTYRIVLTMQPLFEAGMPVLPSSGRGVAWIMRGRSASEKGASRSSSGLPPRNSSLPARACATRHSISPYSSAGTAKNTARPASCSNALASSSPIAAPSSPAICALWPQACAAPVCGSPSGWPATTSASSSPRTANVGAPRPPPPPPAPARADGGGRGARPRREPEPGEGVLHQPRRLDLLEAELRGAPDLLAEPDDLLPAPPHPLPHPLLQLVPGHLAPRVGKVPSGHTIVRGAREG